MKKEHPILSWLKWRVYLPLYRNYHDLRRLPREIKWFLQRGRRGWADVDMWNLYAYNSRIMAEMLRTMARTANGYPANKVASMRQWQNKLKLMATLFEMVSKADEHGNYDLASECLCEVTEMMREYYFNLWD